MPTSPYIDNFNNSPEQRLYEDLIVEAIQMYGHDLYYLPQTKSASYDQIYGEDSKKKFNDAFPVEMYIKSVDGFEGDSDLISKFGLEIRDQITFTLAIRRFEELVGSNPGLGAIDVVRPREGDLLFLDFVKPSSTGASGAFYEIMYVDNQELFFQLGALKTYDLKCEMFRYSSEEFDTGIDIIDRAFSNATSQYVLSGNSMPDDAFSDNQLIQDEAAGILDLSQDSPFGDFS